MFFYAPMDFLTTTVQSRRTLRSFIPQDVFVHESFERLDTQVVAYKHHR